MGSGVSCDRNDSDDMKQNHEKTDEFDTLYDNFASTESENSLSHEHAAIMFRGSDKIYILRGDEEIRYILKSVIDQHWGVQTYEDLSQSVSYLKLKGFPFERLQLRSGNTGRLIMMSAELLRELATAGWILSASSNLIRTNHVATWFFKKQSPGDHRYGLLKTRSLAVISISSSDQLYLANMSHQVEAGLVQIVTDNYRRGIQSLSDGDTMARRIKLNGTPWDGSGETKTDGRLTLLAMMAYLEESGYSYYGCSNMKGTTDTLYFLPNEASSEKSKSVGGFSSYMLVGLDDTDMLRIFGGTNVIIAEVGESVIGKNWVKGIQNSGPTAYGNGFQFKIKGKPWWCDGEEAVAAREMLIDLFGVMSRNDYEHYATIDMSRKLSEKSSIIFRQAQTGVKEPSIHACITMTGTDKLRFIRFPPNLSCASKIKDIIKKTWPSGIQDMGIVGGATELKLKGNPWSDAFTWKSPAAAATLMSDILEMIEKEGWKLISAADVSAKYHADQYSYYPLDVDCWILGRMPEQSGVHDFRTVAGNSPPSYEAAVFGKT